MAGKTDVIIKVSIVFFISLLSFSIGTFVGKKYSDTQHNTAKLENSESHANHETTTTTHEVAESKNLSDEELAKLTEEFVSDEAESVSSNAKTEETHNSTIAKDTKDESAHDTNTNHVNQTEDSPTTVAQNSHAKGHTTNHQNENNSHTEEIEVKEKVISKENNLKDYTKEKREVASIPTDLSQYNVGKFTVQIGSFNNENDAAEKIAELKKLGFSAFSTPAIVKGQNWYRVSIGLFSTENEAKKYKADFTSKTNNNSAYIQKINK